MVSREMNAIIAFTLLVIAQSGLSQLSMPASCGSESTTACHPAGSYVNLSCSEMETAHLRNTFPRAANYRMAFFPGDASPHEGFDESTLNIPLQDGVLFLLNLSSNHIGHYSCIDATTSIAVSCIFLNVTSTSDKHLHCAERLKPRASQAVRMETGVWAGETLDLACNITTIDPAAFMTFHWTVNSKLINTSWDGMYQQVGNRGLRIANATMEHSGLYTCLAKNRHGSVRLSYIVTVSNAPESSTLYGQSNYRIDLECPVQPPRLRSLAKWRTNGTDKLRYWDVILDHGIAIAVLNAALHSGKYTCYIDYPGLESRNIEVTVKVLGVPSIVNDVSYDAVNHTLSWSEVPYAEEYRVSMLVFVSSHKGSFSWHERVPNTKRTFDVAKHLPSSPELMCQVNSHLQFAVQGKNRFATGPQKVSDFSITAEDEVVVVVHVLQSGVSTFWQNYSTTPVQERVVQLLNDSFRCSAGPYEILHTSCNIHKNQASLKYVKLHMRALVVSPMLAHRSLFRLLHQPDMELGEGLKVSKVCLKKEYEEKKGHKHVFCWESPYHAGTEGLKTTCEVEETYTPTHNSITATELTTMTTAGGLGESPSRSTSGSKKTNTLNRALFFLLLACVQFLYFG